MDVILGTLREGRECGDDAVAGILSHGCGSAAMPVPGGSACVSRRRRTGATGDGVDTVRCPMGAQELRDALL